LNKERQSPSVKFRGNEVELTGESESSDWRGGFWIGPVLWASSPATFRGYGPRMQWIEGRGVKEKKKALGVAKGSTNLETCDY